MSDTEVELAGPLEAVFQNPKVVRENIAVFRKALPELLKPGVDIVKIHGKDFKNKSGWNIINQYFGVHTETVKSWVEILPDGEFAVTVAVRAFKGPRAAGRSGTCTSLEMKEKHKGKDFPGLYSACHGMAETRGIERASGAFFMDADVSAEEVEGSPGPMKKEGEPSQGGSQKEGYCACPDDKVDLVKAGGQHGCRRCQRQVDEVTAARILEKKDK